MTGDNVAVAERLARQAHKDQVDRAGQPYVGHLERVVANLLRRWPEATGDEIAAAWLHDVIEDTQWDADLLLRAGVPPGAVEIVQALTRPAGLTYQAWVKSLAALGSLSAVRVKLADNDDNTAPGRVAAIPEGESMLRTRYLPARNLLEARIARAEINAPP
jgi:(p)ppGpp synthase/HD superfamily hydrolase